MSQRYIQWDQERTPIKIRLTPEGVKETPWPHETVIFVKIGDAHFEAMVPTLSLSEDRTFVTAQQVGRIGDKVVVVLPVGNDGTTYWRIPEDEIHQVLVE